MKQRISQFSALTYLFVLVLMTFMTLPILAQKLHFEEAVQKAETEKQQFTPAQKKINYALLKRIQKMDAENASALRNTEALVEKYSSDVIQVDKEGRIYIKLYLQRNSTRDDLKSLAERLKKLEGKVANTQFPKSYIDWMPELYAWVPFNQIQPIASDSLITNIAPVVKPVIRIGNFTTPGDQQLNAELARQFHDVDGNNNFQVKVGCISDGIDHWQNSYNTGDLPNIEKVLINGNDYSAGDEGTAMLEIIHDIAPGAELLFSGLGNGGNIGHMESAI